jgi:histidine triad (HIT) family protein
MPPQGQCPYCQLIENPDQLLVVSETDNFYAWLEINPRARGHTQVVPKEHKESVMEFSLDEYEEAMRLVRKVIEKAEEGLGADGASVTMNVGEAAGQMLPHAYISVFPRFQEEENAGTPTGAIFPQNEDAKQQLEETHEAMSSVTVDLGGTTKEAHPDSKRHEEKTSGGGFDSRLVDRDQVEGDGGEDGEVEEEASEEETRGKCEQCGEALPEGNKRFCSKECYNKYLSEKEDGESEETAPDTEAESSGESEEEDELKGEGHWDGSSFEWQ